ncbi:hypothetical protein SADUNF_Sadunf19G0119600 [Salix dunnii]|uniref:Uncharacterized protein n=1 Tax=Salix dunnii TaxID=1413687 RepID=A0A835MD70_9ROSI|nr:hypothetical protein SADUNF_Sadunf19G0119600 [Salix dunnii]
MLHKYFGLNGLDCVLKVGLLCERLSDIEGSISKVGSRDRLKLVTDELPEDISYAHIKICLEMQTYGISLEATPPSHLHTSNANECVDSESEMFSTDTKCAGTARKVETSVKNMSTHCCSYLNEEKASLTVRIARQRFTLSIMQIYFPQADHSPRQRQICHPAVATSLSVPAPPVKAVISPQLKTTTLPCSAASDTDASLHSRSKQQEQ